MVCGVAGIGQEEDGCGVCVRGGGGGGSEEGFYLSGEFGVGGVGFDGWEGIGGYWEEF